MKQYLVVLLLVLSVGCSEVRGNEPFVFVSMTDGQLLGAVRFRDLEGIEISQGTYFPVGTPPVIMTNQMLLDVYAILDGVVSATVVGQLVVSIIPYQVSGGMRQLVEGPDRLVFNDRIYIYQNGQVVVSPLNDAVQESVNPRVGEIRSQCQEQGNCPNPTPQSTKRGDQMVIFILDDMQDLATTLSFTIMDGIPDARVVKFTSAVTMMASTESPKYIILDGDLGDGTYGWELKKQITKKWKNAVLIGWSDFRDPDGKYTAEQKFKQAGMQFVGKSYDVSIWKMLLVP